MPLPPYAGNNIFLSGGLPVLPQGGVMQRLAQGNFGPVPNNTAPPGFTLPANVPGSSLAEMLAAQGGVGAAPANMPTSGILGSGVGQAPPATLPTPPPTAMAPLTREQNRLQVLQRIGAISGGEIPATNLAPSRLGRGRLA